MTTFHNDLDNSLQASPLFYDEQINRVVDVVNPQFAKIVRSHVMFHLSFAGF
jgi:hypothetical protein